MNILCYHRGISTSVLFIAGVIVRMHQTICLFHHKINREITGDCRLVDQCVSNKF